MTIRRPALVATLAATALALTACGSDSEPDPTAAPTAETTVVPSETLEPVETVDPEPSSTPDPEGVDGEETPEGDAEIDPENPEGEEPPKPVVPKIAPERVALTFQQALFAGDGAVACDQLTQDAAKRLIAEGVSRDMIDEGQDCNSYAVAVANSYADWDVSMDAFPVDQRPRNANARLEMVLDGTRSQVRMALTLVGAEWKITDWGHH